MLLQVGLDYQNLQALINGLYEDMIPQAFELITVGQGLAGIGASLWIFWHLWPSMAGGKPLDFYPLLRPFALLMLLLYYMTFVDVLNAILDPVVQSTNSMVVAQNQVVLDNITRRQQLIENAKKKQEFEKKDAEEGWLSDIAHSIDAVEGFVSAIPDWLESGFRRGLAFVLELCFYAVGLIINGIRTFFLIMLVILGPLALGVSFYPGFEGTFQHWIGRYVQIFMWLPVANILGVVIGKFQALMVEKDIDRMMADGNYDGADLGYMIFLMFGICAYWTVPTVASWVIESTGAGRAVTLIGNRIWNGPGSSVAGVAGHYSGRALSAGYRAASRAIKRPFRGGKKDKATA